MSSDAVAQWRDDNGEHVQPIVEIAAKQAVLHHLRQVAIGGGDDAHIHVQSPRAAQALEFLFLKNAQQLGLKFQRDVADFVKKQRAAVGEFEAPHLLRDGPGEGASSRGRTVRFPEAQWGWRRN